MGIYGTTSVNMKENEMFYLFTIATYLLTIIFAVLVFCGIVISAILAFCGMIILAPFGWVAMGVTWLHDRFGKEKDI